MAATGVPVITDDRALTIFTDGSSYPSPRRGGWAFRLVVVDESTGHERTYDESGLGYAGATNQQMELMACIKALEHIVGRYSPVDPGDYSRVVIYTDSQYVADNFTNALFRWPTTRWMNRDGNPVENAQLWQDLVRARMRLHERVDIEWRKGHSALNPHNKAVDKLAKSSAKGPLQAPITPSSVRRKRTEKVTVAGSIRAAGQMLSIRVINDKWLPVQRTYAYRCEVLSKRSPYFGNVDVIYADLDIVLRPGRHYQVRLNDDPSAPRIVRMYRELERKPLKKKSGPPARR